MQYALTWVHLPTARAYAAGRVRTPLPVQTGLGRLVHFMYMGSIALQSCFNYYDYHSSPTSPMTLKHALCLVLSLGPAAVQSKYICDSTKAHVGKPFCIRSALFLLVYKDLMQTSAYLTELLPIPASLASHSCCTWADRDRGRRR